MTRASPLKAEGRRQKAEGDESTSTLSLEERRSYAIVSEGDWEANASVASSKQVTCMRTHECPLRLLPYGTQSVPSLRSRRWRIRAVRRRTLKAF